MGVTRIDSDTHYVTMRSAILDTLLWAPMAQNITIACKVVTYTLGKPPKFSHSYDSFGTEFVDHSHAGHPAV